MRDMGEEYTLSAEYLARFSTPELKRRIRTLDRRSSTHAFRSEALITGEQLKAELRRREASKVSR